MMPSRAMSESHILHSGRIDMMPSGAMSMSYILHSGRLDMMPSFDMVISDSAWMSDFDTDAGL